MAEKQKKIVIANVVEKAATLLFRCLGYLEDIEANERNGDNRIDTYYAIDTDVVTLYLEPEKKVEYVDVFGEGSGSETSKNLSFLLSEFLVASRFSLISNQENHKSRFLLIPPHDIELIKNLTWLHNKLSQNAEISVTQNGFEKLTKILGEYEKKRDTKTLSKALSKDVPELVELFNPYKGPKAALMRFEKLAVSTFQRIDTYYEKESEFSFPIVDTVNSREDRQDEEKLKNKWKLLLDKHKLRRKQPESAIENDVQVLATLESANSRLLNSGKQVVLITGSRYLFDAGTEFKPFKNDERSFAEIYFRHPQAFLANPQFFRATEQQQSSFKLMEWLSLFFPKGLQPVLRTQNMEQRRYLRNILAKKDADKFLLVDFLFSPKGANSRLTDCYQNGRIRLIWPLRQNMLTDWRKRKNTALSELAHKLLE